VLCTNRKLGSSEGPFEHLSRGSLYEWFTPQEKTFSSCSTIESIYTIEST